MICFEGEYARANGLEDAVRHFSTLLGRVISVGVFFTNCVFLVSVYPGYLTKNITLYPVLLELHLIKTIYVKYCS